MLPFLRANPGLMISAALILAGAFVCLLLGFLMVRGGASLRPIFWFGGLFALIAMPMFFGHLWLALRGARPSLTQTSSQDASAATSTDAAPSSPGHSPFGSDVDPQFVLDGSGTFTAIGSPALSAQFATLPDGESVLLGNFASASQAEKAWVNYLRATGLTQLGGQGDSQRGYLVTRPAGDRAYALPFGSMLGVWTASSDAAIVARMQAGGFSIPPSAPIISEAAGTASAVGPHTLNIPLPPSIVVPVLAAYAFVVVLFYFKGAAWAGTSPALLTAEHVPASALVERLESINALDVPFSVERGTGDNELIATWRYADAKWVDHARAHGLRRTFRIRMKLDESTRTVRCTDYVASYDWSAGRGGASIEWRAGLGIVFFQQEHARVFGLQLDEHGGFKPELSYAYTFSLDEMKSPLRDAVTRAGWNWRPTVWQGPMWLRWLTE